MKKQLKTLAAIALALVLVWCLGRYGWKLLGFRSCGGTGISFVEVSETQVEIKGFNPSSFPAGCVGYVSKEENNTLYLGVRYDALFGLFELGSFDAVIPTKAPINRVVLRTSSDDFLIWDAQQDTALKNADFFP